MMTTTFAQHSLVSDILPWPDGQGFAGGKEWWAHINLQEERKRIDQLFGSALLSETIHAKLLEDREENLLDAFGLSEQTKILIRSIDATTISELATALAARYSQEE